MMFDIVMDYTYIHICCFVADVKFKNLVWADFFLNRIFKTICDVQIFKKNLLFLDKIHMKSKHNLGSNTQYT